MKNIVSQVHKTLVQKKKTIAVAESCTGGLFSSLLTQISGSSRYFILGIVAYNNKAKIDILKVPAGLIAKNGAVSREVAQKMALQVRKIAKTSLGIAITGIAGPTGGTLLKPVGTVFVALSLKGRLISREFHFTGSRRDIRKRAAMESLRLLHENIYCD